MKNLLISIIIPVYNTELYVKRCLDSILNQTYQFLEIIVVNDGSNDNSLSIIKKKSIIDDRIIIINHKNQGISNARNIALHICKGDYIMFVDSDDWLELNAIEILIKELEEKNADLAICNYFTEFGKKTIEKKIIQEKKLIKQQERVLFLSRLVGPQSHDLSSPQFLDSFSPVWGKIFKRNLINQIDLKFIDLKIIGSNEDLLFNIDYIKECEIIVLIPNLLYHYRKNDTSYTKIFRKNLYQKWLKLFEIIGTKMDNNDLLNKSLQNRIALSIIGLSINEFYAPNKWETINFYKFIFNVEPFNQAVNQLEINFMPIHWKLFFISAKKKWPYLFYLQIYIIEKIIRK